MLARLAGSNHDKPGHAHEGRDFITATEGWGSNTRMSDQECVLRFFAFHFLPPELYRTNNFDLFLNNAMKVGNQLSAQKMDELITSFTTAMKIYHKVFKDKAFRKFYRGIKRRYPINKALFEAVSVSIAALSPYEQDILVQRRSSVLEGMRSLLVQSDFDVSISQGTGGANRVRYRFAAVKKLFDEVISLI